MDTPEKYPETILRSTLRIYDEQWQDESSLVRRVDRLDPSGQDGESLLLPRSSSRIGSVRMVIGSLNLSQHAYTSALNVSRLCLPLLPPAKYFAYVF